MLKMADGSQVMGNSSHDTLGEGELKPIYSPHPQILEIEKQTVQYTFVTINISTFDNQ